MVTGRVVEYESAARTYWLPREHAASLTRTAGPDNLAEPVPFTISTMQCMTVSLAQGGERLGARWGKETRAGTSIGGRIRLCRGAAGRGRSAERLLHLSAVASREQRSYNTRHGSARLSCPHRRLGSTASTRSAPRPDRRLVSIGGGRRFIMVSERKDAAATRRQQVNITLRRSATPRVRLQQYLFETMEPADRQHSSSR